jgi:N-acetylglucosaminyldiphosphoundecaprenol N-acetyl-beta-D-mannosaminyltransferase
VERGTQQGERRRVLDVWLDAVTLDEAVARCATAVEQGEFLRVGCVNAAKLARMRKDARLRDAVTGCDLVLADGQSVVWASRLLGQPLPERVAGIDLLMALLPEAARRGQRVYFLGAREEVLERMLTEVADRYPDLKVAGARNGYFTAEEAPEVADAIREAGTDLLFLGMSSPKKELFEEQWGPKTGAPVIHGVGGSFDVIAGEVRRAPVWWREHGLEWLYRMVQEPLRLGPRYVTTNLRFMALVARAMLRRTA